MKSWSWISRVLLIAIPVSICFSERLNTFIILVYALAVILQRDFPSRFLAAVRQTWVYPFVLLYLLHLLSLWWTEDINYGFFILEKKASLFGLPLLIAMDQEVDEKLVQQVLRGFVLGSFFAVLFCLSHAAYLYMGNPDSSLFFYHELGRPLGAFNAIYFSYYLFLALVFLDYLRQKTGRSIFQRPRMRWGLTAVLCAGMILLSSRLFIALTAVYFLFSLFRRQQLLLRRRFIWIAGLAILLIGLAALKTPRERFTDLWHGPMEVLKQDTFQYDTRFSGLTLRLLFLKFGWEILQKNQAWLSGVGIGDARNEMNAAIIQHNLYHGNPNLGDTGYLNYGFHNQFMEFWVQTGLLGLVLWIIILYTGFKPGMQMGWQYPLLFFLLATVGFSLIEGLLERQRGVVLFVCFFSVLLRDIHERQSVNQI